MDQYTRAHSSGFPYYTTSPGTTINHTKTTSWPPPIPELPSSLIDSPASSQFSSDASDTGASPGAWVDQHVYEDQLPLLTKDPKLQAYFFRMERTLRTCHPTALHAEAVSLIRDIVAKPADAESSVRVVAKTLAKAGYRKVEYAKSCALIAHEIFCQLQSTLPDASISFMECLVGAVMETFDGYYLGVNLWHLGGLNGLDSVEAEMINVAAFAGDLFALGLLPVQVARGKIIASLAYANQVSTVHCRALHLFLLHAKSRIGPSLGLDTLGKIRRQLILCTRGPPMAYDRMARLWVIECCTVIDKTIEQDRVVRQGAGEPPAVPDQWDAVLSKDGWFSTLVS